MNRQKALGLYLDMKLVQGLLRLLMMLPMPLLRLELLQRLAMMLLRLLVVLAQWIKIQKATHQPLGMELRLAIGSRTGDARTKEETAGPTA